MLFFNKQKRGIVNVKMIITEEKILSNIDKVKKITKEGVLLYGGKTIPISRSRYKAVTEIINRHLSYI